jgi:hypothetical protein
VPSLSGRAVGRARRDDDLDTLQLPRAGTSAAYYWIDFRGRALLRGNTLKDAEPLQQGFRRAMAAAGRGGARPKATAFRLMTLGSGRKR